MELLADPVAWILALTAAAVFAAGARAQVRDRRIVKGLQLKKELGSLHAVSRWLSDEDRSFSFFFSELDDDAVVGDAKEVRFLLRMSVASERIPPFLQWPLGRGERTESGSPRADPEIILHELSARFLERVPVDLRGRMKTVGVAGELFIKAGQVDTHLEVDTNMPIRAVKARIFSRRGLLMELGEALAALGRAASEWLARRAVDDGNRSIAYEALQQLCRHYPDHAETDRVCRQLLEIHPGRRRARAALHIGGDALLALAPALNPVLIPDALLTELFLALIPVLGEDDLTRFIRRSQLETQPASLLRPVVHALRRAGKPMALEEIVGLATLTKNPEAAIVFVEELGYRRDPAAEPALSEILVRLMRPERMSHALAVSAVVTALGRCGSAVAIPLLREVLALPRVPEEVEQACKTAISRIRARLTGVESGGLTLADTEGEGALAFAATGAQAGLSFGVEEADSAQVAGSDDENRDD